MPADSLREKLESKLGPNADNGGFVNGDVNIGLVAYKSKLYDERFGLPKGIELNGDSGTVLPDSIIDKVIAESARQLSDYDRSSHLMPLFTENEQGQTECDGFEAVVKGRRFLIGRDRYFNYEGNFILMTESNVVSLLDSESWPDDLKLAMDGGQSSFSQKTLEALRAIDEGHSIVEIIGLINRYIEGPSNMVNEAKIDLTEFFGIHDIDDLPYIFSAIGLRVVSTTSRYINAEDPTRDSMTEVDALMEAVNTLLPRFSNHITNT